MSSISRHRMPFIFLTLPGLLRNFFPEKKRSSELERKIGLYLPEFETRVNVEGKK